MIFRLPPLSLFSPSLFHGNPVKVADLQSPESPFPLSAKKWSALAGAGLATVIPATLFAKPTVVAGEMLEIPEDSSFIYALEWADRLGPWVLGAAVCVGFVKMLQERHRLHQLFHETITFLDVDLRHSVSNALRSLQRKRVQPSPKPNAEVKIVPIPVDNSKITEEIAMHIPGFSIMRKLGDGAQGVAFLATKTDLWNSRFVIKILKSKVAGQSKFRRAFEREATIQRGLQHPNLILIHQFGDLNGYPYMILEYAEGGDLANWIERQPLGQSGTPATEVNATRLLLSLLDGLEHFAQAGKKPRIHRDIKPHNIFLDGFGTPKLGDFGLARLQNELQTMDANFNGTVPYAPPEAFAGADGNIDTRADLYSLGVTLYEMVTRRLPFELRKGESLMELALRIISEKPVNPRKYNPHLSEELAEIILKAIAQDRNNRYQTASEFKTDLLDFFQHASANLTLEARDTVGF